MNASPPETGSIQVELEMSCPFCALPVVAGTENDGTPSLLHGLPMCPLFEELEPDRFLEACRIERERQAGR
jgi:hypothetical protein